MYIYKFINIYIYIANRDTNIYLFTYTNSRKEDSYSIGSTLDTYEVISYVSVLISFCLFLKKWNAHFCSSYSRNILKKIKP